MSQHDCDWRARRAYGGLELAVALFAFLLPFELRALTPPSAGHTRCSSWLAVSAIRLVVPGHGVCAGRSTRGDLPDGGPVVRAPLE